MEYCCHVWAGAPTSYLDLFDKLQKCICRTVGPPLAASLEPLAHCRNIASLKVLSTTFLLVGFLSLNESTCQTRKNVFISLQKIFSFLRKSNFRILHFQVSGRH